MGAKKVKIVGVGGTAPVVSKELTDRQTERPLVSKKDSSPNQQQVRVGEKELIEVIEKANQAITLPNTMFKFTIHEGTKEIMVRVINEETGEVIREIPPEKILDMVAKMWEMAGIFVDERR